MSAAQLTEHATHAQLQAEVYRCISAKLAAEARGPLGFRLPGLGPAVPEPDVAPAQYCLYQECPASGAPPLQQRRCAEQRASCRDNAAEKTPITRIGKRSLACDSETVHQSQHCEFCASGVCCIAAPNIHLLMMCLGLRLTCFMRLICTHL